MLVFWGYSLITVGNTLVLGGGGVLSQEALLFLESKVARPVRQPGTLGGDHHVYDGQAGV